MVHLTYLDVLGIFLVGLLCGMLLAAMSYHYGNRLPGEN